MIYTRIGLAPPALREVGIIGSFVSQMGQLRLREVKELAPSHVTRLGNRA